MGVPFWTEPFLHKRRQNWLDSLVKFQYQAGGVWYDAIITSKSISGSDLILTVVTSDSAALTITSIRIIDEGGIVAGQKSENLIKTSTQGVLTRFTFPLNELIEP